MKKYFKVIRSVLILAFLFWFSSEAVTAQEITVSANKPITNIKPTMWGVFFEDINFAADGGLYADRLIRMEREEHYPPFIPRQILPILIIWKLLLMHYLVHLE